MHIAFVAPHFPTYQRHFVRALKSVGARVTGIGEAEVGHLPDELRQRLDGYERVGNVCDESQLLDAVRRVQARGWVDRLEATIEAHILPTARVREAATIPGLTQNAALLCRDKPLMKEFLRARGVACARSTGADQLAQVEAFVREVGYPIILKPRAGAGAAGTYRAHDDASLADALKQIGVGRGASVALEEFIVGHEGFYDTLCVGGHVQHEFISHYYPNVLEAMRTRWISPQIVTTNRMDAPGYDEVKELGHAVITALELGTVATHMEWFFGPHGLRFSEIGARPPGVGHWDLYCVANEIDLYREWAHGIVHGCRSQTASRRYSAGIIALRPNTDGHITGYSGVEQMQERFGEWVIDAHLPTPGTPTQPVDAGYMANAWVRMKHPDYDELRQMMDTVGRTVKVYAQ